MSLKSRMTLAALMYGLAASHLPPAKGEKPKRKFTDERKAAAAAKRERKNAKRARDFHK